MVRMEDVQRFFSQKDRAGLTPKKDGQKDSHRHEEKKPKTTDPRINTDGVPVCPECGEVFNQGCRNCFHSRYGNEDPFEPNLER